MAKKLSKGGQLPPRLCGNCGHPYLRQGHCHVDNRAYCPKQGGELVRFHRGARSSACDHHDYHHRVLQEEKS